MSTRLHLTHFLSGAHNGTNCALPVQILLSIDSTEANRLTCSKEFTVATEETPAGARCRWAADKVLAVTLHGRCKPSVTTQGRPRYQND